MNTSATIQRNNLEEKDYAQEAQSNYDPNNKGTKLSGPELRQWQ